MKKILFVLLPLVALFSLSHAQLSKPDTTGIPKPTKSFVNDYSRRMLTSGEIASLNHALRLYQDSTSTQIVVMILDSLPNHKNGEKWDLDDFSNNTFRTWRPGKRGINNGVLMLIILKGKHARIASGTGTEGALPDITALNIIRHDMKPQFEKGDNYHTITAGIAGIKKALGKEYTASKKSDKDPSGVAWGIVITLLLLVFIIGIIIFVRKDKGADHEDDDDDEPRLARNSDRSAYVDESPPVFVPIPIPEDERNDDDNTRSSTNNDIEEGDDEKTTNTDDDDTFTPDGGDTAGGGADDNL
jgi:uncharacterized protein